MYDVSLLNDSKISEIHWGHLKTKFDYDLLSIIKLSGIAICTYDDHMLQWKNDDAL